MTHTRGGSTEVRIVDAAVRLFAQQGFSGTSTREIARLANVNETSLFRYFPRKQDLFWAAVRSRLDHLHLSEALQAGLAQHGDPEVVIPLIVEFLLQTSILEPELVRLLHFGLLELGPIAERVCRQQLIPIFQAITDYLGQCVKDGILRKGVDPVLTTLSLAITILPHQSASRMLMDPCAPYSNTAEAISAYSNFWLGALMCDATAAAEPSNGN
jgi:AcrR family transcriptional regulator